MWYNFENFCQKAKNQEKNIKKVKTKNNVFFYFKDLELQNNKPKKNLPSFKNQVKISFIGSKNVHTDS